MTMLTLHVRLSEGAYENPDVGSTSFHPFLLTGCLHVMMNHITESLFHMLEHVSSRIGSAD
jgi:hypothetical protein